MTASPERPQHPNPIRAIVSASSGNLVEWFDFYAYSTTALYFAGAFFPEGDTTSQLLKTAGIFAVGFVMRPIGSWVFGRIGDRKGRRESMVTSILMMCAGSLMMGCLPTYKSIGVWAPVLLAVARMIQGLSVGGQYAAAATYMSEVATSKRRGFYASFQYVSLIGGQLMAGLVLVILQAFLSIEELKAWGWRVPFFIGALAALVALKMSRTLNETSTEATRSHKDAGRIGGIARHPRALLTVLGYTAAGSLTYYTFTVYMQKYLANTTHLSVKVATNVMTAALFFFMLAQPLFGALSDRIGRRNSMICFGLFGVFGTYPLLTAIGHASSAGIAFGLVLLTLLGTSFYSSISGLVKAEMFPPEIRALAVGLPYAIGNAAFGGTAEYVALWFKQHGIESTFFFYVMGVSLLGLLASWFMPDNRTHGYLRE